MFNVDDFVNSSVQGSNSTEYVPVPRGEYPAYVESVKGRQWQSRDGSQSGMALDITWTIEDQGVKDLLQRPSVTCKQGLMLDFTDAGALDMGKGRNVGLGRVREAVGQNDPSTPWAPSMLIGKGAKVKVEHRNDPDDAKKIYAEVKDVAKLR